MSLADEERAQIVKALSSAALMLEGMLEFAERLVELLSSESKPSLEHLNATRAHVARWREELHSLKQRVAMLTVEPPSRVQ